MFAHRLALILLTAVLGFSTVALAEQPAANSGDVQQLQKQLEEMDKELAEMKKLVESGNLPAQQRQMMMGHMSKMQGQMHGMMSSCCAMDPQSCPAHMENPTQR